MSDFEQEPAVAAQFQRLPIPWKRRLVGVAFCVQFELSEPVSRNPDVAVRIDSETVFVDGPVRYMARASPRFQKVAGGIELRYGRRRNLIRRNIARDSQRPDVIV